MTVALWPRLRIPETASTETRRRSLNSSPRAPKYSLSEAAPPCTVGTLLIMNQTTAAAIKAGMMLHCNAPFQTSAVTATAAMRGPDASPMLPPIP